MISHVSPQKLFPSFMNHIFQKCLNFVAKIGLGIHRFALFKKLICHIYSHGDTKLDGMIRPVYQMSQAKHSNGKNLLPIISSVIRRISIILSEGCFVSIYARLKMHMVLWELPRYSITGIPQLFHNPVRECIRFDCFWKFWPSDSLYFRLLQQMIKTASQENTWNQEVSPISPFFVTLEFDHLLDGTRWLFKVETSR